MTIFIRRERWVIIRDGKDILCGCARNLHFKPVSELKDAAVKTYLSKAKAIASFNSSWGQKYDDDRYKAVKIVESFESYDF